jgi:LmbE family N-acetylglucosaminyl deacetylase
MRAIRPSLCILSPHRDDAVFSLGLALEKWSRHRVRLAVVNVYTRSMYAPRRSRHFRSRDQDAALDSDALRLLTEISSLRANEDRKAFRQIGAPIQQADLRRLDAPVRLSCRLESVCGTREQIVDDSEVRALAPYFRKCLRTSLLLAPLALGNHIDHATVRTAALQAAAQTSHGASQLGFYEDLPYADWTPPALLQESLYACETALRTRLTPETVRHPSAFPEKRRLALAYSSQIDGTEAERIARFSLRYRGGERIWIPYKGENWRSLSQA